MFARHIYSFLLFIFDTYLFPKLIQLNWKNDSKSKVVQLGFFVAWDSNHSSWPKHKLQIRQITIHWVSFYSAK